RGGISSPRLHHALLGVTPRRRRRTDVECLARDNGEHVEDADREADERAVAGATPVGLALKRGGVLGRDGALEHEGCDVGHPHFPSAISRSRTLQPSVHWLAIDPSGKTYGDGSQSSLCCSSSIETSSLFILETAAVAVPSLCF